MFSGMIRAFVHPLKKEVKMKSVVKTRSTLLAKLVCIATALLLVAATSIPSTGYAADGSGSDARAATSQSVTVHVMNTASQESYKASFTADSLKTAGVLNGGVIGCNFLKSSTSNDAWNVLAIRNYVTLEDLFKLTSNGSSNAWDVFTNGTGGTLQFWTTDTDESDESATTSKYTKWSDFTYSAMKNQTLFYKYKTGDGGYYKGLMATTDIPLAIGFERASASSNESTPADTTLTTLKAGTFTETTQFFMGLSSDTVDAQPGTGYNMGKRLPMNITDIYVYPAGVTPADN
jgi:hypothetical protein